MTIMTIFAIGALMQKRVDVDTPEGLAAAVEWQQSLIASLRDQGRWVVPRSGSVIVFDKVNKVAIRVLGLAPETSIQKVMTAMGWKWEDRAK